MPYYFDWVVKIFRKFRYKYTKRSNSGFKASIINAYHSNSSLEDCAFENEENNKNLCIVEGNCTPKVTLNRKYIVLVDLIS